MNIFRSKVVRVSLRFFLLFVFIVIQVGMPLQGDLLDAQAAPALDPQSAPVKKSGEPAPNLLTVPAEINKKFTPIAIASGGISKLRVTVYNLNANPLTSTAWTDNMPVGILIADPPNMTHTCGASAIVTNGSGGTLSAGDTSFMLTGGEVPEQAPSGIPGDCYVEVDVTSYTPGNLINTIPAGGLSSVTDDGGISVPISNTTPASATLNVIGVANPSLSKAFAPNTIWAGETSTLSITIHNNDTVSPLTHVTVTDIFPTSGDGDIALTTPLNYSLNGCGEGSGATLTDSSGGALAVGSTSVMLNDGTIAPNTDCVISVDVTSAVQGNYTNTIPDGNPFQPGAIETQEGATNQDPASAPLNVQAFTIDKAFATSPIAAGETSELTITIENHTPFPYTGAALDDVLPAGFEFIDPPAPGTTNCTGTLAIATTTNTDDTLRFTSGTLPANTVCTITATARALMSTSVGTYTNTLPTGALTTTEGATNHAPTSDSLTVQSLSVAKNFTETEIPLGGTSLLTITISNPSPSPFTNANLVDALPVGLEYVTGTGSTTCASGSVSLSSTTMSLTGATIPSGSIASPGTCVVTSTVRATSSEPPGSHTNTIPAGEISTDEGGTNALPASDSINVTGIEIAKDFSPGTLAAGAETTLTITITNPAAIAFTGAELSDTLPTSPNNELYFTGTPTTTCTSGSESVTLSGSPTTRTVTLTNGTIPASGSCTITATVTAPLDAPETLNIDPYINVIPANALVTDQGASNSSPAQKKLNFVTIGLDKAFETATISYPETSKLTITITNPANALAVDGLTFTDTLPSGLVIADPANASTNCNDSSTPILTATPGSDTISFADGSIGAGISQCTIEVDITAERSASSGDYDNVMGTGALGNSNPDPTPTNTFSTSATLEVVSVSLDKSFQFAGFEAGGTNDLTITLTNPTTEDYINVALDDVLPQAPNQELYYTGTPTTTCGAGSVVIGMTNYANDTISLTGGTIPGGTSSIPGTCTITATVTTDVNAPGASYTNTIPVDALITYVGPDLGPTNKTEATAPVYVYDETAGVTATKSFLPSSIDIFDNSRLRLTFQAPPDTSLTNFSFTDNLPTGMTVSNSTAPTSSSCGTLGGAWPPANGATTIAASGGTIAAGDTCTVEVYVTSNTGTTSGNILTNTISPGDISNTEDRTIPASVSDTLTVNTPSSLLIDKAFYPTIVGPDGRSTLTITLENEGATDLINTSLEDIFPGTTGDGIVIASPPNASTTCTGGTLTAVAGTQTLQMTGATIPAQVGGVNGICTIVVNVQGKSTNGASSATHTNTIPVDQVVATLSGTPSTMNPQNPASADLTVKDLDLEVVKGFNPLLVYGGADSVMSIILRNPNETAELTGITFTDYMPIVGGNPDTAMILMDPSYFDASDCGPDAKITQIDTGLNDSTFLFEGGYLAPGDECTLTVRATMTVNGNLTNTIPIAEVTSFNGAYNHTATSASLTNLAGASVSKSFAPNPIAAGLGSYSILTIEIRTTASVLIRELGLTDNLLPAGLQVANWASGGVAAGDPPTTTCDAIGYPPSVISAPPGATQIQLTGGVLEVGFENCFLTIPVTGTEPGDHENTIPQGSITSIEDPPITNLQETKDTLVLTPYSLGNRVWYDTNNNGSVDTGEVGVENVRVELYKDDGTTPGVYDAGDTFVKFDTTDADGYYRFDDLGGDDYVVVIPNSNFDQSTDALTGYLSSGTSMDVAGVLTDSIGPDPDDDTDNEDNGVSTFDATTKTVDYVSSQAVTLGPDYVEPLNETDPTLNPDTAGGEATDDQSNRTVDFGFYRQELGNQLFHDVITVDGVYTSSTDLPVEGATVRLFTSDGTTEIFTGADGIWGTEDDGWGPDGISGNTDDGAGGMLSNASGNYLFSGLPEGSYVVKVFTPGYQSTIDTANQFDTDDPNTNADNNDNGVGEGKVLLATDIIVSNSVTLTPGSVGAATNNVVTDATGTTYDPTVDFGLRPIVSIGSIVWEDTDRDGVQDAGEPGIPGATVILLDGVGTPVSGVPVQTTLADGLYYFDGLPEGDYQIQVTVPDGYSPTINQTTADNDDSENDSNIATSSGSTHTSGVFTLSKDSEPDGVNSNIANSDDADDLDDNNGNMTVDFGFIERMSIGNRVFYDDGGTGSGTLNNGIMDGDEQPIANVRVELYRDDGTTTGSFDSGDTLVNWDITDAAGFYLFDGLEPDDYFVHIPAGNFADNFDHDSDGGTAALAHGALQGWYSSNVTGTEDTGVVGNTHTPNTDSDDNGVDDKYPEVNGVTSGLLTLTVDSETTGETELSTDTGSVAGTNPTEDDGPNSRGRNNESDDNSNLTIDFGFIPPLSLGNRVWSDNGSLTATPYVDLSQFDDGLMNGNEAGIENVTLNLYYDANGNGSYTDTVDGVSEANIYRTTTTDASGYYLFDGLPEGNFYVEVASANFGSGGALEGYQSSTDKAAFDDEITDLNDNGEDDIAYLTNGIISREFTLDYITMPTDDDDISGDTAAYGTNGIGRFGEVDASSNLTLDFGFIQTHSIGNIVWRDADNSGTINGPDDANPGIGGVSVHLYADNVINATGLSGSDGIPDDINGGGFDPVTDALKITTTGTSASGPLNLGYYLFDNLPAGNYIVGIPASNFAGGGALEGLRSSTGTPSSATYTTPTDGNADINDHGIDPTPGDAVYSPTIPLGNSEPTDDELPANLPTDTTTFGPNLRGNYNETNAASDLTVDFGFFGGLDVPFSIGNHLWFDDGRDDGVPGGAGVINDGIRQDDELPVVGARVEIYRDGDANGHPDYYEYMRYDITDSDGFYLFDNLDPGDYIVVVNSINFEDGGVLAGWYSSQGHGIVNSDADDNDDNGIDTEWPETAGVESTVITLERGVNEPLGETYLSNDSSMTLGFSPTAGDGTGHIGRFGETDETSNMTVDFGFIPPMSVGNRVWIDDGADSTSTGGVNYAQYNDGIMNGDEIGVGGVRVVLYNSFGIAIRYTDTDSSGYYLFDRLQPGNYTIKVIEDNFGDTGVGDVVAGDPLLDYVSSFDAGTVPTDDDVDINDNGIDDTAPITNGIISPEFEMKYGDEPLTPADETDISAATATYGVGNVGLYGQLDANSNLTFDFGFVQPRSLGNRVWFDTDNDGILNNGEQPVSGVTVSLYLDQDADGIPDGAAIRTDTTDTNGYYLFDNLAPTGYVIGVDASNFASTGNLFGYFSSTTTVNNASNNTDSRDNGINSTNPAGSTYGVLSATIDLSATSGYPTGEAGSGDTTPGDYTNNPTNWDGANSRGRYGEQDIYSDLTIDFGFYKVEIGNLVYRDENANGTFDAGDVELDNVIVKLYESDGITPVPVGPDGILNTADDSNAGVLTGANGWGTGEYLFTNLPEGNYVVAVTTPVDLVSTIDSNPQNDNDDPDIGADNNDNGVGVGYDTRVGQEVPSNVFTVAGGDGTTTLTDVIHYNNVNGITTDNSLDFGFTYAYALGNRVWFDTDNSATINGSEVGVANVTVQLYASDDLTTMLADTTTDASGYYLFDYLTADDYVVVIPAAEFGSGGDLYGYWSSTTLMQADGSLAETTAPDPDDAGADSTFGTGDDDIDSDDNGTLQNSGTFNGGVISQAVTLGNTSTSEPTGDDAATDGDQPDERANMKVDFGFYRTEIGNLAFIDADQNGTYLNDVGAGEIPLDGVTIRLFNANNTQEIEVGPDGILGTADDTTGGVSTGSAANGWASGEYRFSGLPEGNYIIRAGGVTNYTSTIDTFDASDSADPDDSLDNNDNGLGTDANPVPSGQLTVDGGEGDDHTAVPTSVHYYDHSNGTTTDLTVDFGFIESVAIGNRIWFDDGSGGGTANDGIQNGTEAGVDGVNVQLYDSGNNLIATTSTDGNGNYVFDQLLPGEYYIVIPASEFAPGQPLDGFLSSTNNGSDETSDQNLDENGIDDTDPATNGIRTPIYDLNPNTEVTGEDQTTYPGTITKDENINFTADLGFLEYVAIGNRVWFDTGAGADYNDGEFDAGESPVVGITVNLYTSAGVPKGSTTTDTNGHYEFDMLAPGDYYVQIPATEFDQNGVDPLYGYVSSTGAGTDETTDEAATGDENGQDANPTVAGIRTNDFTLAPNSETTSDDEFYYSGVLGDSDVNFTADFGFVTLTAIGNRVWLDDGTGGGVVDNGIQDGGEAGINNVTVELYRSGDTPGISSPVATTITQTLNGEDGSYQFDLLNPGDYFVHIPAAEFLSGGDLAGHASSDGNGSDETSDQDADENGIDSTTLPSTGISSPVYTLSIGGETTADNEGSYSGYLLDENVNFTADFGFLEKVAIGNIVWLDNGDGAAGIANNGIMDGNEAGIGAVTVELHGYGPDGIDGTGDDITQSTTTDTNGYYAFDNLLPGFYYLHIPAEEFNTGDLQNLRSSVNNGSDETTNEDADENGIDAADLATLLTDGITSTVYELSLHNEVTGEPQPNYTGTLADDSVNFTADFGFTELVAIGNRVWLDTGGGVNYNDGEFDAGESGINGVTVNLYTSTGTFVATTTTADFGGLPGYYEFDNLLPGQYYVQIPATDFDNLGDPLYGYVSTTTTGSDESTNEASDENGIDANPLTSGIRTQNYDLQPNSEQTGEAQDNYSGALDDDNVNFTADLSFVQLVGIGNRVWLDTGDGGGIADNGIQDGGEAGILGVEVELFNAGDDPATATPVATTTTDALGDYYFDMLNPGDYFVHIPASEFAALAPLEGYVSSTGAGGDDSNDQDADENGIDENDLPTNGISSNDYALAPDLEPATDVDTGYPGYLDDNNVNLTADFSFLQKVAIGNIVWLDNGDGAAGIANNGIMDGSEAGIDNVTVELYGVGLDGIAGTADDTPEGTTTTSGGGFYNFDNLLPGSYYLHIPATEFASGDLVNLRSSVNNGSDETTNEDADENGVDAASLAALIANGIDSTVYDLQPNSEATGEPQPNYIGALDDDNVNFTADFGFTELVAIGNRVWLDTGGGVNYNDGEFDAGESGINGVTVNLYTSTGTFVATTTTADFGGLPGYYEFDNLLPGQYYVQIPATDFDNLGDPLYGYVSTTTTGNDESTNEANDENGIDANPLTSGIRTQNYDLQPNSEQTGEAQDNYSGALDDDNVNFTADLSFVQLVGIGNRVWLDTGDGGGIADNGIQDGGEAGILGVEVELFNAGDDPATATPVATTTTDALGDYYFDMLNPGDYFVHIPASEFAALAPLEGYVSSTGAGGDDSNDQNTDENGIDENDLPTNGISSNDYALAPDLEPATDVDTGYPGYLDDDNVNLTADFSFLKKVALGNRVWFDTNNDAILDTANENGVNGVTVELYSTSALTTLVDSTTTNAEGYYLFNPVNAGEYVVVIPAAELGSGGTLEGYYSSGTSVNTSTGLNQENAAPDPDNDTDLDDNGLLNGDAVNFPGAVVSQPITLSLGGAEPTDDDDLDTSLPGSQQGQPDDQANMSVDFGFYQVEIGNLVYRDENANGTYDSGTDTPLGGQTVNLYRANDLTTPVDTTTTDGSGDYIFIDLPEGNYVVSVITPADLVSTIDSFDQSDSNTPDDGTDNNDNGVGVGYGTRAGEEVFSNEFTVSGGDGTTTLTDVIHYNNADGITTDNSLDFGFTYAYALGNRVWFDTDNSATINGSEVGVANVTVQLYASDDLTTMLADTTTDASGYYLFDYLTADDYVVVIPAAEFGSGGDLYGYWSSTTLIQADGSLSETTAPDPDDDVDSEDNGTLQTGGTFNGGVISQAVTLGNTSASEPTGDDAATDGDQPDARANMTVDFGFYKTEIGNLVFGDVDKDGAYTPGTDTLLENVTVQLFVTNGTTTTEVSVGPDGILGTADDALGGVTTNVSGEYSFSGLPAGDTADTVQYIVRVTAPTGTLSTNDDADLNDTTTTGPDANTDNNDNGQGESAGVVSSGNLTMNPGADVAKPNRTVTDSTGTTTDPTVDFGFTAVYALGNRVWYDTNNSAVMDNGEGLDASSNKVGADGVTLELYADTGNATSSPTGTFVSTGMTTVTANGGYYLFDNLENGHYRVVIPATEFDDAGDTLYGYWSSQTSRADDGVVSETAAASAELNTDFDDNGTLDTSGLALDGAVVSDTVILGLSPSAVEPTGESDTDVNANGTLHQGNQPDNQANMTVDFGFYTITLGDLVWNDANTSNNGLFESATESGIDNVTVQLLSGDGSTVLDSDVTAGGGLYSFTGLPAGNYILRIPEAEFQGTDTLRDYYSSTGGGSEPAPAPDTDVDNNDDNGSEVGTLGFSGGYIQSDAFALTPYAEDAATSNNDTGLTNEPRIDFGVYRNPIYNLSITKSDGDGNAHYLQGGTIKYTIVVTNNGPADVSGATVTDTLPASITAASWTCAGTGGASCTASGTGNISDSVDIPYGEQITYSITATVSDTATGDIVNSASVEDPDGHVESDDHTDHESSLTVTKDDGFTVVSPGSELTYTIVVTNTGDTDLTNLTITDTLPAEVDFVSASDGGIEVGGVVTWLHNDLEPFVGADTTLLAPGEVKTVTITVTVKDEADLGLAASITNQVTVEDDNGTIDSDDDIDTLARENVKALLETNHAGTTDPIVTIGEILTYRISLKIPAGVTMTNVKAVDILDAGLAFVDCAENNPALDGGHDLTVTNTALLIENFGGATFDGTCNHGTNAAINNPVISPVKPDPNAGSVMTLDLGDVENTSESEETISLTYRVVVLDVAQNSSGSAPLNNIVTWTWDGGELSGEAEEVEIIEPDMDIEKSTDLPIAPLGSTIPFTLEIYQTDISSADAYDVIVTDVLPDGLEYVDGSVSSGSPLPYDSFNYDPITHSLTFTWDYFPLDVGTQRASTTITFDTTFVGPSPVINEANVEWTSLPIDPELPDGSSNPDYVQSDYHDDSTERWYDPSDADNVNDYGRNSEIEIRVPALPETGFAPNRVTLLPEQSPAKTYDQLAQTWVEVPALDVSIPIVGVPLSSSGWDLTWLGGQAGYLEGTAYPGLPGNTAITGHVYLPNGAVGPFVNLHTLKWGDKVILHANGQRYTYEVRTLRRVWPDDLSVIKHEDYDWITLITCQGYDEDADSYDYRVAVRAVLIETVAE